MEDVFLVFLVIVMLIKVELSKDWDILVLDRIFFKRLFGDFISDLEEDEDIFRWLEIFFYELFVIYIFKRFVIFEIVRKYDVVDKVV